MKIVVKNSSLVFATSGPQMSYNVEDDGVKNHYMKNGTVGDAIEAVHDYSAAYILITDNVNPGDKFKVSSKAGNNAKPWAFIDADNIVLTCSTAASGTVVTEELVTAPANATGLVCSLYDSPSHDYTLLHVERVLS